MESVSSDAHPRPEVAASNFCARCQVIFTQVTDVLLCWDAIPTILRTGQPLVDNGPRYQGGFHICYGWLSLLEPVVCDFCAFVRQVACLTRDGPVDEESARVEWPTEAVVVILRVEDVGKVQSKSRSKAKRDASTQWRKALTFQFLNEKCLSVLPAPGIIRYHYYGFERHPLQDYFLAPNKDLVRLVDFDGTETSRVNNHRMDASKPYPKISSARLRPALCHPPTFYRWLEACEVLHDGVCDNLDRPIKRAIRLLDTSSLRLQTFDPETLPRYFTLSYVWGSKKYARLQSDNLIEMTTVGFEDDTKFHPSVSDTIVLMSSMKARYLWVDTLCIIQDSDADKLAQIDQMDAIYANSALTIVAAGDEPEGLPGVRDLRTEINSIHLGGLMLVADARASHESLARKNDMGIPRLDVPRIHGLFPTACIYQ